MDYQTKRPIIKKRQSNKRKHANSNIFAYHNYDFFTNKNANNPIAKHVIQHKIKLKKNIILKKY